jgi:hypothetical protein
MIVKEAHKEDKKTNIGVITTAAAGNYCIEQFRKYIKLCLEVHTIIESTLTLSNTNLDN